MTVKLAVFLITMTVIIVAGGVIFLLILLAMNGFSESDAMWGLGAYLILTLIVAILSGIGSSFMAASLVKKQYRPVVSALITITIFSIMAVALEIICSFIGAGVAEFVRVKSKV